MTIDHKVWQNIVDSKSHAVLKENVHIEYVNIGSETVWRHMQEWLDIQKNIGNDHLQRALTALATSGDFAYESLVKHKSLIDIRQAELRIIEQFSEKVRTYHSEEES